MSGLASRSYTFATDDFEEVIPKGHNTYIGIQNKTGVPIFICIGREGSDITEANSLEITLNKAIFEPFQAIDSGVWVKGTTGKSIVVLDGGR